ncbi:unnamed protein product, partial [Closterium sp. NIES-53]
STAASATAALATAAPAATATAATATAAPAYCATMASLMVLAFDHEGRPVQFDTWLDDLNHFLSLDPTSLTVDLLKQHLLAAETSAVATYLLLRTSGLLLQCKAPQQQMKGGRGGGGGSGGGGGGSGSGGGGSSGGSGGDGGGGGGATGGGSGGSGGGGGGSGGSGGSGGGGTRGGRTGPWHGGPGGGQRQQQQRRSAQAGQTCGKLHTQHRCFSRLDDAWRAEFGDDVELPHWADLLRSRIAIFDLDFDAILSAIYALSVSAEGDCYRCVPPDPCIAAAALGASESGTLPGTVPAQALHTFTLDSGASRCFFRGSTSLTPLPGPIPIRLADPSGSLVVARSSTVLPCPAVPSVSLSGLHLPSFSTNLVSTATLQDAMVTTTTPGGQRVLICMCTRTGRHLATFTHWPASSLYTLATEPPQIAASTHVSTSGQVAASCSCRLLSHQTLLWHHRLGHPSLPRLRGMHSHLLGHERYFLLVVDDYTRYTTVFPLRSKGEVFDVLIPWIRTVRLQLRERFGQDLLVLRLHSDKGGEFSSDLLQDFCHGEGILQLFTLPKSPQQNGIAKHRIGLVMEVALTSMIHAAAPHFLWPFAVQYAAHQLNLWPYVSSPETSPTLRWTGEVGDASLFRVWGSRAFVRDTSVDKLSAHAIPCVFLGFFPDTPGWQFYHPTSRRVFPTQDVTFDESVPFYRLFPYRSAPPPVDPLPPQGPAPSGVSQVDTLPGTAPVQVAVGSGGAPGAASGGAEPGGAESEGAGSGGAEPGGAESRGAEPWGAEPGGAETAGVETGGVEPEGAKSEGAESGGAEPRATGAGGAGVTAGAGGTGGTATAGPGGARTKGAGVAGTGGVGSAGAGDPTEPGGAGAGRAGVGGTGTGGVGAGGAGVGGTGMGGAGAAGAGAVDLGAGDQSQPLLLSASPLPAPSPYTEQLGGLTKCREPASRPISPVRTARRVPRSRPPPVPGTHAMALRPSSFPLRVPLLAPPETSLPEVRDPEFDRARAASPTVAHYATALAAEAASPASVGGECALSTNVLEDRQEDFECLAAAVPRFASMLLAPEGDPDAPDIPTTRSYAEAITGPYSSQWQAAMDAEMASWKSTCTYIDEVPPPGANIVDGMRIFRVKRPPGSPPAFKARYVARGFSQRQGVDYFQTFSPTPKMTTLRVLLHVAAHCDYELHSLDFSTAFLQGSLHEEIWLRRPPGFTGSFPACTQWSLRQPVYDLRQAPCEWHNTLRTTLAALGFAPSTADPSLFLRTDTSLPPFYVLVYVDNLVFATTDTEALTLVKSELQKRHTCTDLGPSALRLPVLRATAHSSIYQPLALSSTFGRVRRAEWSVPRACGLMYLMMCTRLDLAYPLSLLARYLALGRHRKVHWDAAKRVLRYLCSTSGMGLVLG